MHIVDCHRSMLRSQTGGNLPPSVNAGTDQSVGAGAAVTMTASASDPDGSIFSYAWAKVSGTASPTLSGASTSVCTFTAPSAGSIDTLVYRCTVTDNLGATSFDDVQITVAAAGSGPAPFSPYSLNVTDVKVVTFSQSGYLADGTTLLSTNPPTTFTLWRSTTLGQAHSGGTGATSYTVSASGVTVSGIPSGAAYFSITATNSVDVSDNSLETLQTTIT